MASQQFVFAFALVFLSAALAAGQGINPNGCSQGAQKAVNEYNSQMTKAIGEMVSQMSKHGQETANVEQMTQAANQIMSQLSQAANTENLTDAGKMSKIGQQTLDAYIKMGAMVFKSETVTNAISIYSGFAAKALPMYTSFINNMITACGPTSGGSRVY